MIRNFSVVHIFFKVESKTSLSCRQYQIYSTWIRKIVCLNIKLFYWKLKTILITLPSQSFDWGKAVKTYVYFVEMWGLSIWTFSKHRETFHIRIPLNFLLVIDSTEPKYPTCEYVVVYVSILRSSMRLWSFCDPFSIFERLSSSGLTFPLGGGTWFTSLPPTKHYTVVLSWTFRRFKRCLMVLESGIIGPKNLPFQYSWTIKYQVLKNMIPFSMQVPVSIQ